MSDTPSEQGDKIDLIGTMRNEIDALREQLAEKDKMLKTMRPFFNEYALGPLAKPSCLCCGRNDYKSVAVQHAELPGIVVCDQCKHAEMQLAERDAELAALKGHAEAMAERLDAWARIDECKCSEVDAYRRDFPKEEK